VSVADLFLMRLMREVHCELFTSVNGAPRSDLAEKAEHTRKTWSVLKAGKASAMFGQVQKAVAKRFPHLVVKCIDPVDTVNAEAEEEEEEEEDDDDDDETAVIGSGDNAMQNQNPTTADAAVADTAAADSAPAESAAADANAESAAAADVAEIAAAAAAEDGGADNELAGGADLASGADGGVSESAAGGAVSPWAVHTPAALPSAVPDGVNHEENQSQHAPSAAAATQALSPVQTVCKSLKVLRFKYMQVIGATPEMVRERIQGHMDNVSEIMQNCQLDQLSTLEITSIRKAVLHGLGMYACNKISSVSARNEIQAAQEAFKQIMLSLLPNSKEPFTFSMHRVTIGDESDSLHPNIWNILSQITEPWQWAYMYCVLPYFSFTGGIMKAGVSMHHPGVSVPESKHSKAVEESDV
jgi:hypothetical protein